MKKREYRFPRQSHPQWGRQRGGGFAAEKGSQPPALLCSVAPSKGRGSRGHSLLPMEGGAPKGRRLDGGKRYERERGRSSQVDDIREHPSAAKKEANPASLRSAAPSKGRGSRGHSLLPLEGGAPKGRRLDGDGGVKESEGDLLEYAINESTLSTADAVPLPPMGKAAIRGYRFSRIVKANTRICRKRITTDKAFPAWGRWRAERAG